MKKIILMSLALMGVNTILCDTAAQQLAKKYKISGNFGESCDKANYDTNSKKLTATCKDYHKRGRRSSVKVTKNSYIENIDGQLTNTKE